jgi:glycerophosphoryl diester phosphodiesterase
MKLMAHRGLCWDWPENSLLSFRKALEFEPDIIEFDVRLSKDEIPVIMHDDSLDRTTESKGLIAEKNFEEIRKARITYTRSGVRKTGEPVPTLEETVDLLKNYSKVLINCEIKDYSDVCIEKTILPFRKASILDRTYFSCFDYAVLQKVKNIDPSLKVQGYPLKIMKNAPNTQSPEKLFDYVGFPYKKTSREEVDHYKGLGIITGVWTVDDPEDLVIVRELNPDILCTNRIDIFNP